MDFRVLPSTPVMVRDDGVVISPDGSSPAGSQVLDPRYRTLLRLFIVSAAVVGRADQGSREGAAITSTVAAGVLGGRNPTHEVSRAVMNVRRFLTASRGRDPVWSRSLGGKRAQADGGGRQQTDEAFIRTVRHDGAKAYRFVLRAADTVDWSTCQSDIADASQAFSAGDRQRARALARTWREALDETDLDLAFDFTVNNIWQESDRLAVRDARLRTYRILALTGPLGADSLQMVQRVLTEDLGSLLYDGLLAEVAVKSTFLIERTRERCLEAIDTFVYRPDIRYTQSLRQFQDALKNSSEWEETKAHWSELWGIDELDAALARRHTVLEETAEPRQIHRAHGNNWGVLPDPLTPGFSVDAVARIVGKLDPHVTTELSDISLGAIGAVEYGDFSKQEELGSRLIRLADDLPYLRAVGLYFVAEGKRLQADMAHGQERIALRQAALEGYQESRELDPESVRTIRGLARTMEVLGEPEDAAQLFQVGYLAGLQQLAESDKNDPDLSWELNHEILRITRHYAHCLADLSEGDVRTFLRHGSENEVHRLALESSAFHRERLPRFKGHRRWAQIETFMGLTLLAKSYLAVADDLRAGYELSAAYVERTALIDISSPLTAVDIANLKWWLSVASRVKSEPSTGWHAATSQLEAAIWESSDHGVRLAAIRSVEQLCRRVLPPQIG